MKDMRHNIINRLYLLKGVVETYIFCVKEGRFQGEGEKLRHAEESLEKVYKLAEQVLGITKRLGQVMSSEEKEEGYSSSTDVKAVWREAWAVVQKECDVRDMEMIDRIPENFPLIACRKEALAEIFYNLARNSVEAMDGRGKLIIRAQKIFSVREEPSALITVADTGPGIAEDRLGLLFQPFYSTKLAETGMGFGLCLTKALVIKNGGRINVSSYEGSGSTFTLEFPLQKNL